ncbi:hypothetical protein J6T66_05135 [bacterium]|nr:hypothetical protein [bacterium]
MIIYIINHITMPTNMLNIPELETWQVILCCGLFVRELVRKAIALYKA